MLPVPPPAPGACSSCSCLSASSSRLAWGGPTRLGPRLLPLGAEIATIPRGPKLLQPPPSGMHDGLQHKQVQGVWKKLRFFSNPLGTEIATIPRGPKVLQSPLHGSTMASSTTRYMVSGKVAFFEIPWGPNCHNPPVHRSTMAYSTTGYRVSGKPRFLKQSPWDRNCHNATGAEIITIPPSGMYDGPQHQRVQGVWNNYVFFSNPLGTKLPQPPRDRKL